MLLACNSIAGWRTNVWPSADYFRFVSTNDYVNIKDRSQTFVHHQQMTVTSQYPLAEMNTNGSGFQYESTNIWHGGTGFDSASGLGVVSRWFVDDAHIISGTEFQSPKYTFYSWTAVSTNPNPAIIDAGDSMTSNKIWYTTNSYNVGGTNLVIETLYNAYTNIIQDTDYYLDVKELRSLDTFDALAERANAWSDMPTVKAKGSSVFQPVFFRGPTGQTSERSNLVGFKGYIKGIVDDYINPNLLDTNDTLNGFFETNSDINNAVWTLDSLISDIGCPTNYFDYTPVRQLNGAGHPFGRVVTNEFSVISTNGTATNTVVTYHGTTNDIVGTNGQVVTVLSTNANIYTNTFDELDYGWKYITNAINKLEYSYIEDNSHIWTTAEPYGKVDAFEGTHGWATNINATNSYDPALSAYNECYNDAVANITNFNGSFSNSLVSDMPLIECNSRKEAGFYDGKYTINLYSYQGTNVVATSTNLAHTVQIYANSKVPSGTGSGKTEEYDAHNLSVSNGVYYKYADNTATDSNSIFTVGDKTVIPNQAPWMEAQIQVTINTRGWVLYGPVTISDYPVLIKYDWDYK